MGKKIFRTKKSIAPLKPSPKTQIAALVGNSLDSQKEKLLSKLDSNFSRQTNESIDDAIKRLWNDENFSVTKKIRKEDDEETEKKFRELRKVGRAIHNLNKAEILKQIAPTLDKREGESNDQLVARLLGNNGNGISNKKLLKLKSLSDRLSKEFDGSRDKLVDALMEVRKGSKGNVDATYRNHLNKKSVGTLLLQYDHS